MCERVRAERSKMKKYIYIFFVGSFVGCWLIIFEKVIEEKEKNFQRITMKL